MWLKLRNFYNHVILLLCLSMLCLKQSRERVLRCVLQWICFMRQKQIANVSCGIDIAWHDWLCCCCWQTAKSDAESEIYRQLDMKIDEFFDLGETVVFYVTPCTCTLITNSFLQQNSVKTELWCTISQRQQQPTRLQFRVCSDTGAIAVGLLMMTIWLVCCTSYSSNFHHHLHHPELQ